MRIVKLEPVCKLISKKTEDIVKRLDKIAKSSSEARTSKKQRSISRSDSYVVQVTRRSEELESEELENLERGPRRNF